MLRKTPQVSQAEILRQAEISKTVAEMHEGGRCHIITYGCQMNAHDSEKLLGMMAAMGYSSCEKPDEADVIIFNTCCIRENAERRLLGNLGKLRAWKEKKSGRMLGVCGCMTQQEGVGERIMKRSRFVDFVFGTHNTHALPEILLNSLTKGRQIKVEQTDGVIAEGLPVARKSNTQAYVTIMYGCDNFCSYCVVPYVRGRQRSRDSDAILSEIRALAAEGVYEITLLGQNVNSYGLDSGGPDFARLLRDVAETGVPLVRFMTSHPKDFSAEAVCAMAEYPNIAPHIHLPVQSGSDAVLSAMNRRYTSGDYLRLAQAAREKLPSLGITSDVIVGFPAETEEDFAATLSLVEKARFDGLYTFEYSPRSGTRAKEMQGQIPDNVKSERLQRLIEAQKPHTANALAAQVGLVTPVLLAEKSARDDADACGRTPRGFTVNVPLSAGLLGTAVKVEITRAKQGSLVGRLVQ